MTHRLIQAANLTPAWPNNDRSRNAAIPGKTKVFTSTVIMIINAKSDITIITVIFPGFEQANFSPNTLKEMDSSDCLFALIIDERCSRKGFSLEINNICF